MEKQYQEINDFYSIDSFENINLDNVNFID